jgi:hypothetical protein
MLNEYFDPVSLEKSEIEILPSQGLFCQNISIHTADNPIGDLSNYKVALIGVPEGRAASFDGIEMAPDIVRDRLYKLNFIHKKPAVIDLGNLKQGRSPKDTYFGLRDVMLELFSKNILPVVIGGSQDLTYGMSLAFEYLNKPYTFTTIDNRIDIAFESYDKINYKN